VGGVGSPSHSQQLVLGPIVACQAGRQPGSRLPAVRAETARVRPRTASGQPAHVAPRGARPARVPVPEPNRPRVRGARKQPVGGAVKWLRGVAGDRHGRLPQRRSQERTAALWPILSKRPATPECHAGYESTVSGSMMASGPGQPDSEASPGFQRTNSLRRPSPPPRCRSTPTSPGPVAARRFTHHPIPRALVPFVAQFVP